MFNIFRHKGNANQNYTEIVSHPSHSGYHQENKQQILERKWGERGREKQEPLHTIGGHVS
jgi:hypothetical protein